MEKIILSPDWKESVLVSKKPHQTYKLKNGEKVPGTTTILGALAKPALIHWSAMEERKGIIHTMRENFNYPIHACNLEAVLPEKYFYAQKRDKAADVGSCAHFMCECFLNNNNPSFEDLDHEIVSKAYKSFEKFRSYWETSGFTKVETECQLVSEKLGYGGTSDCVAMDQQGNHVLLDFKTNKSIYKDSMGMQMASYKVLWEENRKHKISRCELVRIGKESEDDFEIWKCEDIIPFETSWFQLVTLYHSMKGLPK